MHDLYWAYLQRAADAAGYLFWLNEVRTRGRAAELTGERHWVLTDQAGSVRVVLDEAGEVVGRRDNLPFGQPILDVGSVEASGATMEGAEATSVGDVSAGLWSWHHVIRPRYAGMEKDVGTGLEHTPYRKYESALGRWTSPDPYPGSMSVADPQSFNRYSYVQNDPVNFTDPSGLLMSSGMWTPGQGGYGCDAAYGSCGGGWDGTGGASGMGGFGFSGGLFDSERFNPGSAGEAAYERRLQNTRDAIAARNALNNEDYDRLADILNSNENVGLSADGEEFYGALGGLLASAMGGEFGNAFQRGGGGRRPPPPRRGSGSPRFPNLRSHRNKHPIGSRPMTLRQYLESAIRHTQNYESRYLTNYHVNGHNFRRYNYVTRLGPDSFLFTSTSENGRVIFTHMVTYGRYIRNQGIQVQTYPPGYNGPFGRIP